MKISKLAMAAAAFTCFAGTADAQSVVSDQRNNANIRAQLNARVTDVTGEVAVTAAGIGNSFTVDGASVAGVRNYQNFWGDASSLLNSTVDNVAGDVAVTSAAIANSATITTSTYGGAITNTQLTSIDPTATLNATISNVGEDVSATAAALSNSASIDSKFSIVNSVQNNRAGVASIASATVHRVAGDVAVTSAAIGNSLTVTGF